MLAVQDEGAQVDMAWLDAAVDEGRRGGELDGRLGDVILRIGSDLLREILAFLLRCVRADQHAVAAALAHRLHHEFVEIGEHMGERFLLAAQIGLDIVEDRLFGEVIADEPRDIGIDRLVVGDAGAQGIGNDHIARPIGVEDAGHAERGILAEDQRIDEIIVDAAVDHVDALEARGGAGIDDIVVDQEVAAFHQLDAHLAREEGVLEEGGVEHAGREHRDRDVVVIGREAAQCGEKLVGIVLDGAHAGGAEHGREGPAHHVAVGEHVGDAGGDAEVVFQHDEIAGLVAHQIAAADIDIGAVRHGKATHLAAIVLRPVDHRARHDAVLQDARVAIDVAEEQIEHGDALAQASIDAGPFLGGDDARQKIGRDDPLGRLVVAVDGEGDALMQEGEFAGLLAAQELAGRQRGQSPVECGVVRAHRAVGGEHLVIGLAQRVVFVRRVPPGQAGAVGLVVVRPPEILRMRQRLVLHPRNVTGFQVLPSSGRLTGALPRAGQMRAAAVRPGPGGAGRAVKTAPSGPARRGICARPARSGRRVLPSGYGRSRHR